MASQIDFVIATGIFILFTATLVYLMLNYLTNYFNISTIADLRTIAYDTFYAIFSGPGIPSNWENNSYPPVKIGLITNLYEVPFVVNDTGGTTRTNLTIAVTFNFDSACQNKAWNNTIRIYDSSDNLVPLNLYNTTFCASQYVQKADAVFNLTLQANSQAKFYLYYSPQRTILPNSAGFGYTNTTNYTVTVYPELTLQAVSVDKLLALRNLTYGQISQIISPNFKYYLEVGK